MTAQDWLDKIMAAHGGMERWRRTECIEADFSSGGLAFTLHMQATALHNLKIKVWPHDQRVELHDFTQPGWTGLWTPDHVQLLDGSGQRVDERRQPRQAFGGLVKQVRWDRLDILYFAGYALWNYLSFPFLLRNPGCRVLDADTDKSTENIRLQVRFDPTVPTHSMYQTFHVHADGTLVRHDYTADVIGPWAKAANQCLESVQVGGLRFYTRRRVTPRLGKDTVLPGPTLVWIELRNMRLIEGAVPETTAADLSASPGD